MLIPDNILVETFLMVAQERNLSIAASNLRVSQPTLTKRLQKLESLLPSPLFYRHTRPLKPTNLGQRALLELPKLINNNKKMNK